jgi:hypothetical protein
MVHKLTLKVTIKGDDAKIDSHLDGDVKILAECFVPVMEDNIELADIMMNAVSYYLHDHPELVERFVMNIDLSYLAIDKEN